MSPWVLDSAAIDHISGNKALLSCLSTSGYLPIITLANGSKMQSQGIGIAHPMPSMSVDSVLYVSGSPSNLLLVA